jgi:hypothetical protein
MFILVCGKQNALMIPRHFFAEYLIVQVYPQLIMTSHVNPDAYARILKRFDNNDSVAGVMKAHARNSAAAAKCQLRTASPCSAVSRSEFHIRTEFHHQTIRLL